MMIEYNIFYKIVVKWVVFFKEWELLIVETDMTCWALLKRKNNNVKHKVLLSLLLVKKSRHKKNINSRNRNEVLAITKK